MAEKRMEHVVVIGGGVGGAIAHDLTLRGYKTTLLEKGELTSGASGAHHGLLHSGGRYAIHDVHTAAECMTENLILKRIAPFALEKNGGLFIAVSDEDMEYKATFKKNCRQAGIPALEIPPEAALKLVPALTPSIKTAVMDHAQHKTYDLEADIVINASGPWGGKTAALAGVHIPIRPGPGVMVSMEKRVTELVINRLHPAGDGDIVVPQRNLSILGTSAWLVEDPDDVAIPRDHIKRMITLCSEMLPILADLPVHAAWCASRPLIVRENSNASPPDPTKISRGFEVADHGKTDGVHGFLSVLGGKATTMRAMAEETVDAVCRITGRDIPCTSAETPLINYRNYFMN